MVATSFKFYKKIQNLKYNVKRTCIFHLVVITFRSIFSVKNRGQKVLLNRQNLTKA